MNDEKKIKDKFLPNIQSYLSIGYLFLLLLGIIKESIFYGAVGINILNYASITDVLLSPIALMADSITVIVVMVFIGIWAYWSFCKGKAFYEKHKHKKWYKKLVNVEKLEKSYVENRRLFIITRTLMVLLIGFYLGTGIGSAIGVKHKLDTATYKTNTIITFDDNEVEEVFFLGQTSDFIFYVTKEKSAVVVAPLLYNIKKMEHIETE